MADDWRTSNWGDEVTLEYGKAIRGYSQTHGKYRVFGSNGPIGWTCDALTQGPGVVLGRKGAYRGVEFSHEPFWVIDTAYYVAPKTDLEMRWLYYAVKHYKLGEVDDGSPIPSTTRAAVYMLELDVPPKHEQRAIAHILGTLDDKIALNRRANETLEAMARAMFKAWFVDFEPVRAKLEGRWQRGQSLPGLPSHLFDHFPNRLVESALGEVPEGWFHVPLRDLASTISKGTTPSSAAFEAAPDPAVITFLKVKDLTNEGEISRKSLELIPRTIHEGALKRSILAADDLLFSIAGTIGRVALVDVDLANSNCNQAIAFVRLKDKNKFQPLCWLTLRSSQTQRFVESKVVQGVQANASLATIGAIPVLVPSDELLLAWNNFVQPLFQELRTNQSQSRSLSQLRDTLLPKLISGELRVPHAERIVGVVV